MTKKKSGRVALARSTALRSAAALQATTESAMPVSEWIEGAGWHADYTEAWAQETIDELVSITTDDAAVAKAEMAAIIHRRSLIAHEQLRVWIGEEDAPANPIPA